MAEKTRQGWSSDQGAVLIVVTQQLQKDVDAATENIRKLFAEIKGEEIIGECEVKEPILEGIAKMEQTFDAMGDKFNELSRHFDKFAGQFDAAIASNIKNSEDAVAILHKAATDVKEATGKQ